MTKIICFESKLLRSAAFRSLKKWSLLVYLDFLRKRQMEKVKHARKSDRWIIRNNGEIVYPYVEAEHRGIGRREFRNAIDELIAKGLLDITHLGSGGRAGDMTRYMISERWKIYGTDGFQPPLTERVKDTRQGRGWSAYHAKKRRVGNGIVNGESMSSDESDIPVE